MDTIAEKLVTYVSETTYDRLPKEVTTETKKFMLDTLGVGLAGVREPGCREVVEVVKKWSPNNAGSTIIYYGDKVSPPEAAFANSVLMHALDFDDYHGKTVIHATATCLPAILAIAEDRRLCGVDILTALVLAIDISIRLGLGLTRAHYERGWHSTSTAGRFGATAGVTKLLKLNMDAIINAFGICGTQASGIRQVFGTMSKPFNAGKSSMDGVISAMLAEKGFTSSKDIIEGKLGFFEVFTDDPDTDAVLKGLGSKYYISDLSIKPYPTCA